MVSSSQDAFSNFIFNGGWDPFCKITEQLDTRTLVGLSQVNKTFREISTIWHPISTKHQLGNSYFDTELREKVSTYLNTALPYTFICVDQNDKTLSVKKYIVKAYPETRLEEIVNLIYSKSIAFSESCEVTLTQLGQRSRANVLEIIKDPFDYTKANIPVSQPAVGVAAYSFQILDNPKILADISVADLSSENPVGGPCAVYNTPKKQHDWTWEKFSVESTFPGANQASLDSVIGLLRDKTIILHGPYIPTPVAGDPQMDPGYPGNFF